MCGYLHVDVVYMVYLQNRIKGYNFFKRGEGVMAVCTRVYSVVGISFHKMFITSSHSEMFFVLFFGQIHQLQKENQETLSCSCWCPKFRTHSNVIAPLWTGSMTSFALGDWSFTHRRPLLMVLPSDSLYNINIPYQRIYSPPPSLFLCFSGRGGGGGGRPLQNHKPKLRLVLVT